MIVFKCVWILSLLLLLQVSVAASDGETEELIITEDEFDLELEILNAAAAGLDEITFQEATYIRETTINLSEISNMTVFFESGSKILLDDVMLNVVEIRDCEGIDIYGGYFSHIEPLDSQDCHGSVFVLSNSNHISIGYCEVMGCGSIGFLVTDCISLEVTNCKIRENSWCAFYLARVNGLYIADCEITDNGELFTQSGSISRLWMIGNTIADNGMPDYP